MPTRPALRITAAYPANTTGRATSAALSRSTGWPAIGPTVLALLIASLPSAVAAQGSPPPEATPAAPAVPAAAPETAPAADPASAPALERVEITGGASDTALRRDDPVARTVIGRDELLRMGDSSVPELLKRLPGVTLGGRPGRGGEIRLRGMGGGYTQFLINGERVPPGFSFDAISPDQLERIEILRAPTAETGAQAVAGTINIVLREDVRKRAHNPSFTLVHEDGGLQPQVGWTRTGQVGALGYQVGAQFNASNRRSRGQVRTLQTLVPADGSPVRTTLDQVEDELSDDQRQSLSLNGRLLWKLDGGDTLSLTPFLLSSRSRGSSQAGWLRPIGDSTALADRSTGRSEAGYDVGRASAVWQTRLGETTRLELRGGVNAMAYGTDAQREEFRAAAPLRRVDDHSRVRDRGWTQAGKFSRPLGEAHQLAAGWELDQSHRRETRSTLQDSGGSLSQLQDDASAELQARSRRSALWLQDEWNLNAHWGLHAGLRWEGITTTSSSAGAGSLRNRSEVWSPLLHALWRPEPGSRDQVRASLTRSYRAPSLQNLVARRSLSSAYPVSGPNLATSPDRIGNPDLRPELATGLDLAYEHYLARGGVLSVGVFERRLRDLIRTVTTLQTVDWSDQPRWVSQPRNLGNAVTRGVELEARLRLAELVETTTPLELRGNLSLFRSRVDAVPGPDNRLDQQPGWTANAGADYRVPGWPLTLGGNLQLTPAYAIQQTELLRNERSRRRVLDAYALWAFHPEASLRLSASNLAALDSANTGTVSVTDAEGLRRESATTLNAGETTLSLRLELKL